MNDLAVLIREWRYNTNKTTPLDKNISNILSNKTSIDIEKQCLFSERGLYSTKHILKLY